MAIFPHIETEVTVQENDKTRIDATKSFVDKGEAAITLVEIEPEAGAGFIDVTGTSYKDWYLDYEFATAGTITSTVRITTDGAPTSRTQTIAVVTEAVDKLFSNDQDLKIHEHDILKYVPQGKSSFKYMHRRAQSLILDWLDRQGYTDTGGVKLGLDAVVDITEVKEWSTYLAISLIFADISNVPDDIFDKKVGIYTTRMLDARNRSVLRLDLTGDGNVEVGENIRVTSSFLVRR